MPLRFASMFITFMEERRLDSTISVGVLHFFGLIETTLNLVFPSKGVRKISPKSALLPFV